MYKRQVLFPVLDLIECAAIVYAGYKVGQASDALQHTLDNVNTTLSEMKPKVDAIIAKVDDILARLDQLLKQIAGVVDHKLLVDALADYRGIHQNLKSYMSNMEWFDKNIDHVISNCDDLTRIVSRIVAHSETGVAAMIFASPAVALWAQAWNLVLKKKSANVTIWQSEFHLENYDLFQFVFDENRVLTPQFDKELKTIPTPDAVYEHTYEGFKKSTIPFIESGYPDVDQLGKDGLYTVGGFSGFGPTGVLYSTSRRIPPPPGGEGGPGYHPVPGWYWWRVGTTPNSYWQNPDQVQIAAQTWQEKFNRYQLIQFHQQYFARADEAEKVFMAGRHGPTAESWKV